MRRVRRAVCAGALCASASACGYPSFDFVPDDATTNDTSNDQKDAAIDVAHDTTTDSLPPDTHPPSDSTPPSDTTASETTPPWDTTPPSDSTADTTPLGDAVSTGCTSTHRFCDDWNTSATADAHWMSSYVTSGALALDTAAPYSPPQDFLSSMSATTAVEAAATLSVTLTAPLPDSFAIVDCEVYIDGGYAPGAVLVKMQRPGTGRGFDVSVGPTDLYVEVLGTTSDTLHLGILPMKRWFHVRMKGQLMTSGAHVTVWIDDMTTPVYDKTALSTATVDSTTQELSVGLYTDATGITDYHARFDDCSLDFL